MGAYYLFNGGPIILSCTRKLSRCIYVQTWAHVWIVTFVPNESIAKPMYIFIYFLVYWVFRGALKLIYIITSINFVYFFVVIGRRFNQKILPLFKNFRNSCKSVISQQEARHLANIQSDLNCLKRVIQNSWTYIVPCRYYFLGKTNFTNIFGSKLGSNLLSSKNVSKYIQETRISLSLPQLEL